MGMEEEPRETEERDGAEEREEKPVFAKGVWLVIGLTVVMLALPFAMVGWVARDYWGGGKAVDSVGAEGDGVGEALRESLGSRVDAHFAGLGGGEGGVAEICIWVGKDDEGGVERAGAELGEVLRGAGIFPLKVERGEAEKEGERYLVSAAMGKLLAVVAGKIPGGEMRVRNGKSGEEVQMIEVVVRKR